MKIPFASTPSLRFLLGLILAFAGGLQSARAQVAPQLNPDELDQLLGPIALYPDALVALILPASTFPTDIVLAQRYLSSGGDPDQIDYQPWNDSVKGLARYPMLIQWLDENLTWTQQLGGAFINQPDAVMGSVQHLRAKARANGTLTSTPQQKVVLDGDIIEIVPAQPDVIYVPYYDPSVVYGVPAYYGGPPYVTFGVGFGVGYWLAYDFNWHTRVVIVGDRHHNWYEHHDWDHHSGPGGKPNYGNNWHPWTPPVRLPSYTHTDSHHGKPGVSQPRPMPRAGSTPTHAEPPHADNNSRNNDHNRPPGPPNDSSRPQDSRDHRPPTNLGTPHGAYPQPTPPVANPHSGPPVPVPNTQAGNQPGSPVPNANVPGPRPDMGKPHPTGTPNQPVPTRPPSGRPPVPVPVPATVSPSYPVAPQPSPPPPPPPQDKSRDDKPEVQR